MGVWFKNFFQNLGLDVLISDSKTELANIELAKKADIVIVSVPINKTIEVIKDIQSGKISLELSPLSPIGKEGMEQRMDMMMPARPSHTILMAMKKRLEKERMVQVCMNCYSKSIRSVASIPDRVSCENCGGVMLATVRRHQMDKLKLLKKKNPTPAEKKVVIRA